MTLTERETASVLKIRRHINEVLTDGDGARLAPFEMFNFSNDDFGQVNVRLVKFELNHLKLAILQGHDKFVVGKRGHPWPIQFHIKAALIEHRALSLGGHQQKLFVRIFAEIILNSFGYWTQLNLGNPIFLNSDQVNAKGRGDVAEIWIQEGGLDLFAKLTQIVNREE